MKIKFTVMEEGIVTKSYIENCNYKTLGEELDKLNNMYPSYLDASVRYTNLDDLARYDEEVD